jgi:predicted TPR repeat methyltransferase
MNRTAKSNVFQVNPGQVRPASPSAVEQQMAMGLYAQEKFIECERFSRQLTTQYPMHGLGWKVLGATLVQLDRAADALPIAQTACKLLPADAEAYSNLGGIYLVLGHMPHAETCYRTALELAPDFEPPLHRLIELLVAQKRTKEAVPYYRQVLAKAPDNEYVQHLVASFSGESTDTAPAAYVKVIFDDYADNFDHHIQEVLGYKIPGQLVALMARHADQGDWRLLDLGCGTGLVGAEAAPHTKMMVGVDLSPKMLEKAAQRQVYQRLECAEVLAAMQAEPEASFDVVVAADVFVYVGQLDAVVAQAHRVLRPGGLFACSLETMEDSAVGYQLQSTGRYKHTLSYMNQLASQHGFKWLEKVPTVIRSDNEKPIQGSMVVWQR